MKRIHCACLSIYRGKAHRLFRCFSSPPQRVSFVPSVPRHFRANRKPPRHRWSDMARRSTSTLLSVALLLSFFVMNTVFNVFNKWLFSGPIRAPLFITATHQLACFMLAASTACVAPWAYSRTPLKSAAMVRKLAIIPFGFCVNIGLNNISLLYVTLALNQLVRSFAPVCVAIASYIFEDKVYSARYYATLVALTAGTRLRMHFCAHSVAARARIMLIFIVRLSPCHRHRARALHRHCNGRFCVA